MVLFLVRRYFLLQLVIPNVIVRLRRVFPTACIRPTVPIGDELLDSISTSAVECFRPPPVIFITPILKYRDSVTPFSTMYLRIARICSKNFAVAGTMVIRFIFHTPLPK